MITFLFWNIRKNPILNRVARLARRHAVDLLVLAECEATSETVLAELTREAGPGWDYPSCVASRLKIFTKLPSSSVVEIFSTSNQRLTIREVRVQGRDAFLLAAVHLVAKAGGWSDHSQSSVARIHADDIERMEKLQRNPRTVLIGDLNMPPFAPAMIDGFAFHSFMTRELTARRSERTVDGNQCRRAFYNPMWRFLIDRADKPAGTFYWHATLSDNHYWYALDQVLVRSELADKVVSIDIIDTDGTGSFVTKNGWADSETVSDHLPILAVIDL